MRHPIIAIEPPAEHGMSGYTLILWTILNWLWKWQKVWEQFQTIVYLPNQNIMRILCNTYLIFFINIVNIGSIADELTSFLNKKISRRKVPCLHLSSLNFIFRNRHISIRIQNHFETKIYNLGFKKAIQNKSLTVLKSLVCMIFHHHGRLELGLFSVVFLSELSRIGK